MNQLTKLVEISKPKLIIIASCSSRNIYWEYRSKDGETLSNSSMKVLKIDNLAIRSVNSGRAILVTNIPCFIDSQGYELPEFDYGELSSSPKSVDFLRFIAEKAGCELDLQLVI